MYKTLYYLSFVCFLALFFSCTRDVVEISESNADISVSFSNTTMAKLSKVSSTLSWGWDAKMYKGDSLLTDGSYTLRKEDIISGNLMFRCRWKGWKPGMSLGVYYLDILDDSEEVDTLKIRVKELIDNKVAIDTTYTLCSLKKSKLKTEGPVHRAEGNYKRTIKF